MLAYFQCGNIGEGVYTSQVLYFLISLIVDGSHFSYRNAVLLGYSVVFFAGHIDYINEVVCYSLEFSSFISKLHCSFKVVAMILFKIFAWITGLTGGVCRFPFELLMSPALPESTICGLSWVIISLLGLLDWQLVCIWGAFCSKLASSIKRRFAARFVEPSFATINYSSYCIKVGDNRFGLRDK